MYIRTIYYKLFCNSLKHAASFSGGICENVEVTLVTNSKLKDINVNKYAYLETKLQHYVCSYTCITYLVVLD